MKALTKYLLLIAVLSVFNETARAHVVQLFSDNHYGAIDLAKTDSISFDTANNLMIVHNAEEEDQEFAYWNKSIFTVGESIPLIEIITDEYKEEITSKTVYSDGEFNLKGFGKYEDINSDVQIRGRGNSSWQFVKKPYRLKFNKKVSLCGLPAAKNYVLLANYMDCSLLQNVLAFEIGEMLELSFTHKAVPVDVVFNGIYKGSYILTNKPGINAGSVDIEEDKSIMWELDISFDEELKFNSPLLNLPVMVADPDLDEETFEYWKNDFIEMEKAVYQGKAEEYIELDDAAKYLAVHEILRNNEIGYPKSFKMFKTEGGKYIFGPLWDFDVAMGKIWLGECYSQDKVNDKLRKNSLISYLYLNSKFMNLYRNHLRSVIDRLPELMSFIDDYAARIRDSALRNQTLHPAYEDFDESIVKLKGWLQKRCEVLKVLYNLDSE